MKSKTHTEIKIITNTDTNILEKKINELLADGWKLRGNMTTTAVSFSEYGQMLYKEIEVKPYDYGKPE